MRTPMLNMIGAGSTSRVERRRFCGFVAVLGAALATLAISGCTGRPATPIHSLEDLNSPDMIIGGETETVSLRMGAEALPKAKVNSYPTPMEAYAALHAGQIDAVAYDRPPLEYAAAQNEDFIVIPDVVGEGHIAVGAPFKNRELMERVNEFIKQYKEDGTYDDMYKRWVKTLNPKMPDIPAPENPINKGNPLKIGNDPQNIPMSFQESDGSWSGFDTEFVKRLALYLNMEFEFVSLYYDALFPAVETEKLDLAVGNLDKTPERAETMLFSDDYIDCPAGIMVLKSRWQPNLKTGETSAEQGDASAETAPVEAAPAEATENKSEATEPETTDSQPAETEAAQPEVDVPQEADVPQSTEEASSEPAIGEAQPVDGDASNAETGEAETIEIALPEIEAPEADAPNAEAP